jgi:hypothetical protein
MICNNEGKTLIYIGERKIDGGNFMRCRAKREKGRESVENESSRHKRVKALCNKSSPFSLQNSLFLWAPKLQLSHFQPVPGSPFLCRLVPPVEQQQQPQQLAQRFTASGLGLERVAVGQPTEFFVEVQPTDGTQSPHVESLPRVQITVSSKHVDLLERIGIYLGTMEIIIYLRFSVFQGIKLGSADGIF